MNRKEIPNEVKIAASIRKLTAQYVFPITVHREKPNKIPKTVPLCTIVINIVLYCLGPYWSTHTDG